MIQHAFSMRSPVNLISQDANQVFYLSVYTLHTIEYGFIIEFCVKSMSLKVQHHDEIGNIYQVNVQQCS